MKRLISLTVATIFAFSLTLTPFAIAEEKKGKLDSFKEEVFTPESSPDTTSSVSAGSVAAGGIFDILMAFFMMGLSQAGTEDFGTLFKDLKAEWSPAFPTLRIEPSYQYVYKNMQGVSGRVEMGYLVMGLDGEYNRYFEKAPNDSLDIWSGHFLWRTMFARFFQTNLALGVKSVRGGQHRTAFEFGFPFYIFLGRHFIFDVLPYVATFGSKNMYDIGGGISYKYKYFGVRAGYRGQFIGGQKLHGPKIGAYFQW